MHSDVLRSSIFESVSNEDTFASALQTLIQKRLSTTISSYDGVGRTSENWYAIPSARELRIACFGPWSWRMAHVCYRIPKYTSVANSQDRFGGHVENGMRL
jgi:hypothetical protein